MCIGPTGLPISALTVFLVQELGCWVDLSSALSDTMAKPGGSVVLPSGSIDVAREKSKERIAFIQRWMAAMLPSLGNTMTTELTNAVAMDSMERLEAILDAVAAAKTQLLRDRDTQELMAKEADERKRAAINELRLLQEQEERVAAESAELLQKKLKLMEVVNVNGTPTSSQSSTHQASHRPMPSPINPLDTQTPTLRYGGPLDALSTPSRSRPGLPTPNKQTGTSPLPILAPHALPTRTPPLP